MVEDVRYWCWTSDSEEWFECFGYGVGIVTIPSTGEVSHVIVRGTPADRDAKRDRLIEAVELAKEIED